MRSLGLELVRQDRGREATGVLRGALREARRLKQRYGVAAESTISIRTAESHVAHIMGRLGLTARAQIAAWIARRQ